MSTRDLPPTYVEYSRRHFIDAAAATATRLRDLADEIERHAADADRIPSPGNTSTGQIAGRIIHSLAWGFANAHSDSIVTAAAEADRALAEQKTEDQS